MTFDEYLKEKKIDSSAFRKSEPSRWEELKREYENSGSTGFTLTKKFIINLTRRKYLLKETMAVPVAAQPAVASPARKKPVMR